MADMQRFGRWMRTFPFRTPVDRVEFKTPDGTTDVIGTFLHQRAELSYDEHGMEHLATKGKPIPAVRYTPLQVGMYRYRAFAGDKVMEEGGVRCVATNHPGYVMYDVQSPNYFRFTNGGGYCPIGFCFDGPPRTEERDTWTTPGAAIYEQWFRKLAENGGNFARLLLSDPYFDVETGVAGEVNLAAFARLDAVIELARTYGIRLKLCIESFRTFQPDAPFSKELRHPEDGRVPESLDEWLREPVWRELWLQKLQAFTARYGTDPIVMSWELWDEADRVDADWDLMLAWTKDMVAELKRLAPRQLATSSLSNLDDEAKIAANQAFKIFGMDIQQVRRYLDPGAPWDVCQEDPVALVRDAVVRTRRRDCPVLLSETGAVEAGRTGPFRYLDVDERGILFNDLVLAAFFSGAAGTGQLRYSDAYVDKLNLWRFLRPIAHLVSGMDLSFEMPAAVDLSTDAVRCLVLRGRGHILAWVRNRADTWQNVLRDGIEPAMLGPQVLDFKILRLNEGSVELAWPWGDAPAPGEAQVGAEARFTDSKLYLPPFRYGLLVKIGPPRQDS